MHIIFCVCMYGGGLSRFRQLLHSSGRLFCVATVRCGKTLVIHDNRVRRNYIKILFFRNAMEQEYGIDISALRERSADDVKQISMLDAMVREAHGVRIAYVADDCGG